MITSATKSWVYDGELHTEEVYTVTYGGTAVEADSTGKVFTLPTGDTVTITATAAGVKYVADSGTKNNTFTHVLANADQYASVSTTYGDLSITKRKVTLTSATDTKVYDGTALTNDTVTVGGDGFAEGEGATYNVTGSQTLVGQSENTFTYTLNAGTNKDNYEIEVVFGTLTVTDGTNPDDPKPVDDDLVVRKTVDDKEYKLGEVVTFEVEATNIYAEPRTITLSEIEGVTLAKSVFENVPAGETITTTATYTITEADILAGEFKNTVTAQVGNLEKTADATAKTEPKNGHLTIEKETTSTPANGSKYALGETISYKITVTNDGNLTITDITVTDELTGDEWTIASLKPGESKEFETSYVVTEADILAGEVVNVATGTGTSPDPDKPDVPVDPGEDPEPTEDPDGHITITKETTSTPANGSKYALGETITYKITVTNDGNLTITDIKVTDELTGDEWTIASLKPGESKEFEANYTVTEEDVIAGDEVVNVATATGTSPDPDKPDVPVDPGEDPEPVQPGKDNDVNSEDVTVVYDGKAHTVSATAAKAGSTVWYSTDGGATWSTTAPSRTAVGTTPFSIKATHPAYVDVVKDGYTLTVTPKDLTIKIDDKTKVYGTEDPEFTYTAEGLVDGETIPANLITMYRDPGEDVGTYTIYGKIAAKGIVRARRAMFAVRGGTTFDASNYNITFVDGELEITPATVTVKADSFTKYVGADDPTFTATVTGLANGDDESVITYTLSRDEGEELGTYTITPAGEEEQGNYIVVFETGTLTITKIPEKRLGDFALVWLTDTLVASEGKRADAFKAITKYVAENAKDLGAIAMLDTGNMVETYNDNDAWTMMKDELKQFKTLVPEFPFYSVAGTKDVNGDEMNYEAYLAAKLNNSVRTFKSVTHADGDEAIWYQTLREQPVLVIGIGYQKLAETDEEKERQDNWLKYLNTAIYAHDDYFVVLLVNDYIDAAGELTEFGKLIEENLVKGNRNVRLILCGNAEGAATWEKTYGDRKVTAMMYNYVADEEKGLGFVRILSFNSKDQTITVQTVNPLTNATEYDATHPEKDNFVIEEAF